MTRKSGALLAVAVLAATALYTLPVSLRGLVGPDEPRYAFVARHMAETGDWITPHLWGEPWFEKPALLFWLGGLGHAAGLESPVRLPVALLSLGFLFWFWRRLGEQFGREVAATAACILGTSAGWVAYSDAGVFDAPLTVFTTAALLHILPWATDPEEAGPRGLAPFGALVGLGVLSKGLVAPIVAGIALLPAICARPRRAAALLGPRVTIPFAAVCLPWYVACALRNGRTFLDEFLIRHHWERFFSSSLEHVQPWWFFGPVLVAFLLPWTPLLAALSPRTLWRDPRSRMLCLWAFGPAAFFSLSVNKLPGYILPALPPLAILLALAWQRAPRRGLLAAAAATLALVPLAGALLPGGLADGVRSAAADLAPTRLGVGLLTGISLAAVAGAAALRLDRRRCVPVAAGVAAAALAMLKLSTYPDLSRVAGTREFFRQNRPALQEACLGDLRRHAAYGLRYYSQAALQDCEESDQQYRVEGDPPRVVPNAPGSTGTMNPP